MNVHDAQMLVDRYIVWLRDRTELHQAGPEYVEINKQSVPRVSDIERAYVIDGTAKLWGDIKS